MIKPKLKTCKTCGELRYIFSHGNCKDCSTLLKMREKPKFKPLVQTTDGKEAKVFKVYQTKAIKKISTKQQLLNAAYAAQRKVYLKNNPYCKVKLENCLGKADTVHHKKGHGDYFLDDKTWLPACWPCHDFVEAHPAWAKEKGFSEDRLTKR